MIGISFPDSQLTSIKNNRDINQKESKMKILGGVSLHCNPCLLIKNINALSPTL
jgi:hypothetical protein